MQIDQIIMQGFGMPMGPFRLNDLVGSDIGLHVGKNFVESFSERVRCLYIIHYKHNCVVRVCVRACVLVCVDIGLHVGKNFVESFSERVGGDLCISCFI